LKKSPGTLHFYTKLSQSELKNMEEELWVMNTRIFDLKKLRVGG
jgi:hypothetical protein